MDSDTETCIRERAYEIWVREGRPHGRQVAHWEQAKAEIATEDAARGAQAPATETPDTPEVAAAPAAPAASAPVRSRSVSSRSRRGATTTSPPAQEAETEDAAPPANNAPQARARKRGAE
jgi:hypothetical protein